MPTVLSLSHGINLLLKDEPTIQAHLFGLTTSNRHQMGPSYNGKPKNHEGRHDVRCQKKSAIPGLHGTNERAEWLNFLLFAVWSSFKNAP